ncbi:MAG: hypothetical protein EPN79_10660 [Burkholderiaceae bacterium]|nr:MAG: hypothetical protein EPN79_10660 [Burkholderiaceae bacterium]
MRTVDLWDIEGIDAMDEDQDVRTIYFGNVLKLGLPIEDDDREAIRHLFAEDWLREKYPRVLESSPAPKVTG